MKVLIIILAIHLGACSLSKASTPNGTRVNRMMLKYVYKNTTFLVEQPAADFNEAIEKGAEKCMSYLKTKFPNYNEDQYLDFIDICVNPNTKKEGWND